MTFSPLLRKENREGKTKIHRNLETAIALCQVFFTHPWEIHVLATWHICSNRGLVAATSSTNHTPDRFVRNPIRCCHSTERFVLLHLCWLLGTSVLRKRRVFRTDVPRSQHRDQVGCQSGRREG